MIILARHGETPANHALTAESAESRVQGFSKEMPLTEHGKTQAFALGYAIGQLMVANGAEVAAVQSSDALRVTLTRDMLLNAADLTSPITPQSPDKRLRELNKGNLEGMLRKEAYPSEEVRDQQASDWHFRHGTLASGGETAYEAGKRWLDWFAENGHTGSVLNQPDGDSAVIVVGHNLVTSFGVWMLTHPAQTKSGQLPSLAASKDYSVDNGSALVITRTSDEWVVAGRIVPTAQDVSKASF